jgi:hypothetical protein
LRQQKNQEKKNKHLFKFGTMAFSPIFALPKTGVRDSVAQLVEHITFNDGVLGPSPSGITDKL